MAYYLKKIPILFYLFFVPLSTNADDPEAAQAEIEALEKQRSELYKQINDAIDDSVKTLAESNDTDSKLGISLIEDLKKQLETLNGTELVDEQLESQNDIRRRSKKDGRRSYRRNRKDEEMFMDKLMKKAENNPKFKERLEHRIAMQSRIEDWLKKKAAEKAKIKNYLYNKTSSKREKCPNYGIQSPTDRKKRKKHKGWYPCCRKCCKNSYMGCLKKK